MRLEYDLSLGQGGDATLTLYLVPTLDVRGAGGLRLAVSVDDKPAQTLRLALDASNRDWEAAMRDNAVMLKASFGRLEAGKHTVMTERWSCRITFTIRANALPMP